MKMEIQRSKEDDSVNFIFKGDFPGMLEARYVRRDPRYFAVYLSSQTGCQQACRFCHLTTTKQNQLINVGNEAYLMQANAVLDWYDQHCPRAKVVHFNFMARGEALNNDLFLRDGESLFEHLGQESISRKLIPRFLVSTIMPRNLMGHSLSEFFPLITPEIYYSIYSVRDEFREKWLPRAMPVDDALTMLKEYQRNTKKTFKLHWAFIEGENDSEEDVRLICEKANAFGVKVNVAIVRYNPYSEKQGRESSEEVIERNMRLISKLLPHSDLKKITRVGRDVKASCGMFVDPNFGQI